MILHCKDYLIVDRFNIVAPKAFCALALTTFVENVCMVIIISYSSINVLVFIDLFLAPCHLFEEESF
jgi:hypothetical protein